MMRDLKKIIRSIFIDIATLPVTIVMIPVFIVIAIYYLLFVDINFPQRINSLTERIKTDEGFRKKIRIPYHAINISLWILIWIYFLK